MDRFLFMGEVVKTILNSLNKRKDNMDDKKRGWATKWSEEEDEVIRQYYPQNGWQRVHQILPNRNKKGIQSRAFKLNVRYLSYNKDYFEDINTASKAYWLGFLCADGYVSTGDRWGLELQLADKHHMENFLNDFDCNINIRERTREGHDLCGFMIKNKKMYNDLVNHGVAPNKTYCLQFPSDTILNHDYMNHFIRGFFDGDGCISWERCLRTKNNWKTSFYYIRKEVSIVCKSEDFLDDVIGELNHNDIKASKLYNSRSDLPTLRISNYENILKFYKYIYKDSDETNRLDRKYNKFNELIATINQ